jgi:hypothetical protein
MHVKVKTDRKVVLEVHAEENLKRISDAADANARTSKFWNSHRPTTFTSTYRLGGDRVRPEQSYSHSTIADRSGDPRIPFQGVLQGAGPRPKAGAALSVS